MKYVKSSLTILLKKKFTIFWGFVGSNYSSPTNELPTLRKRSDLDNVVFAIYSKNLYVNP